MSDKQPPNEPYNSLPSGKGELTSHSDGTTNNHIATSHSDTSTTGINGQRSLHKRDTDEPSGHDVKETSCCGGVIRKIQFVVYAIVPPGGVMSSAFNMASSSIGAGILGLPGATDSAGLLLAMIYLVIITFFSVFSMRILAISAEKTGIRSFEGLGRWLFPWGNYAFSYGAAFIRWFHAFSGNVAYVISIGNCFRPIFDTAHRRNPENKAIEYLSTTSGNRLLSSLVWLCIMLPLVIPKHIDSLRYASAFAVIFMIYFVIIIVIHSGMNGLPGNAGRVHAVDSNGYNPKTDENAIFLFRSGNSVINSVGVFMFAYVCQINAMEIHGDMRPEIRTPRNYTWAAFIAMMLCGILYVLVCVFGYLDFGSKYLLNQSILLMYDPLQEPAILIAYIGVMCKLCVAYALLTIAARNSIYYAIGWQHRYAPKSERAKMLMRQNMQKQKMESGNPPPANTAGHAPAAAPLCGQEAIAEVNKEFSEEEIAKAKGKQAVPLEDSDIQPDAAVIDDTDDTVYIDNIPYWKHLIVVLVLSTASLMCGLFIPNINTVFGFAGALSGGFMAFVFPALFYMYSGNWSLKTVGFWNYFLTYALLISGVVGIIFGTGGTIYTTISG